jgi:hypothetical protein
MPPLCKHLAALLCLALPAQTVIGLDAASGAEPAITAFTTKIQNANQGDAVTFEIGVTSNDATTWEPATVAVAVDVIGSGGTVVQTSDPVAPADEIVPNRTTALFVTVHLAGTLAAGTYQARASVKHSGNLVDTSDPLPIVVGALVAQATSAAAPAPGASPQPSALSATVTGNDSLSLPSSQEGDLDIHAKLGPNDSLETKGGGATTSGVSPPLLTFQTLGTTTQFGTTSIAFDDGVLSGPSGTGIQMKRAWGTLHSLQLGFLSGGDGTPNPYDIYGLEYNMPIRAGTLSLTTGYVDQSGPVATGVTDFLTRGDLFGLIYRHPANNAGFSYQARYGLIDYLDGIAGVWRTDRAMDLQTGFRFVHWDWVLDYNRAGPYYPSLTASGVSPDREDESLTGSHSYGPLKISVKVDDSRTALNGSPSVQTGHVLNETLGLGYQFHSKDALEVDLSNAINHVLSDTPVASLNQNLAVTYSGTRGKTGFQLSVGSATSQDNSGTTLHTITDAVQVTRTLTSALSLATTYTSTNSLGNQSSATNIGQQLGVTANYNFSVFSISSGYNWSLTKPFTGLASPATTGLNLGLGFKPKFTPTTIQATVTRSYGAANTTVGRLNFSRQY